MNFEVQAQPYPSHALPLALQHVTNEIQAQTKAPQALIIMEILSSLSATIQSIYDVKLPTGQVKPTSLYMVALAESGERKTGIHSLVAGPLYEFDDERTKRHTERNKRYERDYHVWKAIDSGLQRQLVKATQKDEPSEELQEKLGKHRDKMPERPRDRRLTRQDITSRAFMDALSGDGESVTFQSDEGSVILDGGVLGKLGIVNKAWDGPSMLVLDRSDGVSVVVRNPRVTFSYMVQPEVFRAYLERKGDAMRASGHWARYLVGFPATTQGTRFVWKLDTEWIHLPAFHERLRELLARFGKQLDDDVRERIVLEFSDDAMPRWIEAANNIENLLNTCHYLNDIKDFASKMLEISARVAALLHVFCRHEGKISCETLNRAIEIVTWHLNEYKRMFSREMVAPQFTRDAHAIQNYLQTHFWDNGVNFVKKNDILRNGPVRTRARVDAALEFLHANNCLWFSVDARTRTRYITRYRQW